MWKLETIGISDPDRMLSKAKEEELAYDQRRLYERSVPKWRRPLWCRSSLKKWYAKYSQDYRYVPGRRLISTRQKLKLLKKFEDFEKLFHEWEKKSVIKKTHTKAVKILGHYLPHHLLLNLINKQQWLGHFLMSHTKW